MISIKTGNFFITLDKITQIKFETKDGEIVGFSGISYAEIDNSIQGIGQGPEERVTKNNQVPASEEKPETVGEMVAEKLNPVTFGNFWEKEAEKKPKRKYTKRADKDPLLFQERIFNFIKDRGGKSTFRYSVNSKTKASKEAFEECREIHDRLGNYSNEFFKAGIDALIAAGRLKKITGQGRNTYEIIGEKTETKEDEKLKKQAEKLAKVERKLQEKLRRKFEEYSREEEDFGFKYPASSLDPDRPIPELQRNPQREIKDQCPRCGNNLTKDGTKIVGAEPLVDGQEVISCIFCGHEIYPEEAEKEEAKAA